MTEKSNVGPLKLSVMAKQVGIVRFSGTIGDLTFYQTRDGYYVRQKSTLSRKRYKEDPAFERSRENNAEFGIAATGASLFRSVFMSLAAHLQDTTLWSRIVKHMRGTIAMDRVGNRGKRNLAEAFRNADAQEYIRGFRFNAETGIGNLLMQRYTVDMSAGSITIADFVPSRDLKAPSVATHVSLKCGLTRIDFAEGLDSTFFTEPIIMTLDDLSRNIVLQPEAPYPGEGTRFMVLNISFLQEINGTLYNLYESAHAAMDVVGAANGSESERPATRNPQADVLQQQLAANKGAKTVIYATKVGDEWVALNQPDNKPGARDHPPVT